MPWQKDVGRWQGQQHAVLGGRRDRTCREQLVQQTLGAVTGGRFEDVIERLGWGDDQGIWILCEQMAEVEGVRRWFRYGDGAANRLDELHFHQTNSVRAYSFSDLGFVVDSAGAEAARAVSVVSVDDMAAAVLCFV